MSKSKNFIINIVLFIIIYIQSINSQKFKNQKNIINLAYVINDRYIEYFKVSIFSLLTNSAPNTIFNIYLLVREDFSEKSLKMLDTIEQNFFNCFIKLIDRGKDLDTIYTKWGDISSLYKIKIPGLLNDINRLLGIDGDTLILNDILELYTLNFKENWVLGKIDLAYDELDDLDLGYKVNNCVNGGVLLWDLYNLRKNGYPKIFMDYVMKYNNTKFLKFFDQITINYLLHKKIGYFHPKYNMFAYTSIGSFKSDNNKVRIHYSDEECNEAYYHPIIIHYAGLGKLFDKNPKDHMYFSTYFDYQKKAQDLLGSPST